MLINSYCFATVIQGGFNTNFGNEYMVCLSLQIIWNFQSSEGDKVRFNVLYTLYGFLMKEEAGVGGEG